MTTTFDLDEELSIQEGRLRGLLITFGLLLIGAFVAAGAVWYFFLRDEEVVARPTEDITVARTTINSTLIISGKADTQLNSNLVFQTVGKVSTVNVRVGDLVTQGQVLATLDSEDLANAIASAQANVVAAQLRLDDLLAGSTAAEVAASDQVVAAARAALTKAENDYQDMLDGPTAAEVVAAEQAVSLAESQLATAQSAREKLDSSPSDADIAGAEAAVAGAQSALTAAENSAESAENTVISAAASLKSAESSYCAANGAPAFCGARSTPISSGDAALMDAALGGANSTLAAAVISANGTYLNAVNGEASADAAVNSAQNALDSAEAKLELLEDGPTAEDVDAAEAAVASAEAAVASANTRLADVLDGSTALDLSTASAAVASARAALESADAKLAETRRGSEPNAIDQARAAVGSAQLTVIAAQIRLKNAQILAPFDGTVAAVNIQPGEFASAAATEPPIVLLTPDQVLLVMDVGETDYGNLKVNQQGVVLFDALPGKPYPFTITEIGLNPISTQGVVTYQVKASLLILGDNPRPAPGMNGRGQLTTDSKPDILTIPPRAIRRKGAEQVVDVRRDGVVQEQVITTGLADTTNVEILSGLNEGDIVVVPTLLAGSDTGPDSEPTLPGGVR